MERVADIGGFCPDVFPMTARRNLEPMVLGEKRIILIAAGFLHCLLQFFIIGVRDALEKEQRENVGLEVSGIHRAAQDIGGFPKVTF